VHPDDRAAVNDAWASCLAQGVSFEAKYRLLRHDGQYRWHLGRIVPANGGLQLTGGPTSWYGTATDVHDLIS
ncbi:MAG: hypothetical protein EOP10_12535, partial [Proteobacteria bacterium]